MGRMNAAGTGMEGNDGNRIDSLLDWHLDRLEPADRAAFEARLRENAALRAQSDRLGRLLRPLDHWTPQPPPGNLADRVLQHISRAGAASRVRLEVPVADRGLRRFSFLFPPKEALAVAACIALLLGVFGPGLSVLRAGSQRALCENNLASIFRGVSAYQASFGGALPFAGGSANASWLPGRATDRPFQSNSRHVFLLIKGHYVSRMSNFVCPSGARDAKPCNPGDNGDEDFPQSGSYSYASINLAGKAPCIKPRTAIPYIGDNNPLFVNARYNASVDPETANSRAHGGRGQTVLTVDGQTRWMTTPIFGAHRDNVWLIGNVRSYTGSEAPSCETDVQLVPGYPKAVAGSVLSVE